ncbi:mechanosensitive ion channel family protein [Candidatus Altiarchaeota archaeon]
MKLNFSLGDETSRFKGQLTKIDKLHSRVIVISFVTVLILFMIQVFVRYNLISLSSMQLSAMRSVTLSIAMLVVATFFLKVTTPLLNRFLSFLDPQSRNIILNTFNYGVWAVAGLVIFARFTGHVESLGISIGVFSAGLAIALQQPITSVMGWLVIMMKKPYKIGDRIVVREIKGDVIDITLFYTVLREFGREMLVDDPTGVKITLPNNIILTEPVLNYTSDFPYLWDYMSVSITYESDINLARELVFKASSEVLGDSMTKAAERMRPFMYGTPQQSDISDDPQVYTRLADSGVIIDVKYLCKAMSRRKMKSEISSRILELINEPENKGKVRIAYPHTQVVFSGHTGDGMIRDLK